MAAGLRAQVEAERRAAAAEKPSMPTYGTAVRRAPSRFCWPLSLMQSLNEVFIWSSGWYLRRVVT